MGTNKRELWLEPLALYDSAKFHGRGNLKEPWFSAVAILDLAAGIPKLCNFQGRSKNECPFKHSLWFGTKISQLACSTEKAYTLDVGTNFFGSKVNHLGPALEQKCNGLNWFIRVHFGSWVHVTWAHTTSAFLRRPDFPRDSLGHVWTVFSLFILLLVVIYYLLSLVHSSTRNMWGLTALPPAVASFTITKQSCGGISRS